MDQRGLSLAEIAAGTGLDTKTVWHVTQGKKTQKATRKVISLFLAMPEEDLFPISNIQNPIFEEQEAVA
ncbi:hypothetical protein [Deinococcus peraridilitoris]|uniref:HTH cro/C1-type domain-containing protein n=1 Tax=Deinococcus peraridilitoris (strain DSM 19664 / LMG 22246 / CIP 109416 / KR-200) TaxID=937777 RepID=L0A119_DEIPD|nr:hypothetical protein [Deinococcus peraridilitoris]AFZ67541.1 hypothetical protein Deipe_2045 [Deinococcus peraridilitoris DSM 19664]